MKKIPMTLETFKRYMKSVKETYDFENAINDVLRKYGADGYIIPPSCMDATTELLSLIFEDDDRWIDYFVYELEFGKKYREGTVARADDYNIPLATDEDLYNLLLEGGDGKSANLE